MSRFEDCDVCGERYHNEYIERYITETIVGTGNDTEVITHCIGCIPKKEVQDKMDVTKKTHNMKIETNEQVGFIQKKNLSGYEIVWEDGIEDTWSAEDIEGCCDVDPDDYWWSLYKDCPPESAIVRLETGEYLLQRYNEQDIIYQIEII